MTRQGTNRDNDSVEIDGTRAKGVVEDLVKRGHRYYGAPKREEAIEHLRALLDELTDQTALQRFTEQEEVSGEEFSLTNIIGRYSPGNERRVLLGTHWDTRLWAEEEVDVDRRDEPIPGANDGTSGIAVLLEVARVVKSRGYEEYGVDYVLFDGEEFGRPGSDDYCKGSRYFARMLKSLYPRSRPELALVIDMVGDCDQEFRPELSSIKLSPNLVMRLWNAASRLGFGEVFTTRGHWAVEDDHTALQKAGIPSALLIDYDYPHWHTHGDTVDKVCASSLERVGKVIVDFLENPEEEDPNG